jgi:hypothetical protein
VGEVRLRRPQVAASAVVWLVRGAIDFLVPLVATLLFSLKDAQTGKCCSLSAFHTFPTYPQYITASQAYPAAAATLMSFGITWAAMLSILLVGRRGGQRTVRVGIGR